MFAAQNINRFSPLCMGTKCEPELIKISYCDVVFLIGQKRLIYLWARNLKNYYIP